MMNKPKRIQLRRVKGWKKPEGAVVVSRPSKWGNPFKIGDDVTYYFGEGYESLTAEKAVHCYSEWLGLGLIDMKTIGSPPDLNELRGKDLACWCKLDQQCHADVLLELANA